MGEKEDNAAVRRQLDQAMEQRKEPENENGKRGHS